MRALLPILCVILLSLTSCVKCTYMYRPCNSPCPYQSQYATSNFGCQSFDTSVIYGKVQYICKSYSEKPGRCPTTPEPDQSAEFLDISQVQCAGDWYCPSGFKCCKRNTVHANYVCKKANFTEEASKDENLIPEPVIRSGSTRDTRKQ